VGPAGIPAKRVQSFFRYPEILPFAVENIGNPKQKSREGKEECPIL
jgi:hypothetical protein